MNMLKVVWVCHFSDSKTREYIEFSRFYYKRVINALLKRPEEISKDFAVWNTNAIKVFETYKDIELTVVFPHKGIKGKSQSFAINGIKYICFRSEDDYLFPYIFNRFLKKTCRTFQKNRRFVKCVFREIKPDIIHIIGAENPYYSITALDVPENTPSIVSLQTLLSAPDFFSNYPITESDYAFRSSVEKNVIMRCDYVGTIIEKYRDIICRDIKPNASFISIRLAVGVEIDEAYTDKRYDFVYFSANISKAADYAIEAFALALAVFPNITLNISGAYTYEDKAELDRRLEELGIKGSVFFTGEQPTHMDVLTHIKQSRFALLPLKVDMISGTIREAMACGLPVVTTRTELTPELNCKRESVLLSDIGNHQEMANNMLLLLQNEQKADELRENGFLTVREKYSNSAIMGNWRKVYYEIIKGNELH